MAKSKTKWKVEIIAIELVIIAALLGVLFVKKVESYNFVSDATYFADSVSFEVPAGSTAKVNAKTKNICIDRKNDYELPATSIPIYYNDQKKVVLMQDMALLKPQFGNVESYRLPYFTELSMDSNYGVTISRDSNSRYQMGGVLFDGENTYFFLEDEYLQILENRIKLPAYSYAYVIKNNYIEYFNYETKESKIEYIDQIPVYVRDEDDTYRINLSTDIISFNSDDVMLSSYISIYKSYFEEVTE